MNTEILQVIVSQLVGPLLSGFVLLARAQNPGATDAEIAADAEGSARHALRQKIGFFVDVLWSVSEFKNLLDAEVNQAVAQNTLPAALLALLPTSAPVLTPTPAQAKQEGIVDLSAPLNENPNGSFTQEGQTP